MSHVPNRPNPEYSTVHQTIAAAPEPTTDVQAEAAPATAVAAMPTRAGMRAAAKVFLASLGPVGAVLAGTSTARAQSVTDVDILNFALNLEYIEAEFYLRATTGTGLGAADTTGTGTAGGVNGGTAVPFTTSYYAQFAQNLAIDELSHVRFLRSALGSAAVARPLIDLAGGFQSAAVAAGVIPASGIFNPFGDQLSFFLGAFIFEDVGVTAYAGAASLISNKAYLSAAASILAVEGYHGGMIRAVLGQIGGSVPFATQAIANLRSQASNALTDAGVLLPSNGFINIAPVNSDSLAYRRTTAQVINIVTVGGKGKGGFLPNGFNGNITSGVV